MRFYNYLNERWFATANVEGDSVEIFVNPNRKELLGICNTEFNDVRFYAVLEDEVVYMWDGMYVHDMVFNKIKNKLKGKTIFQGDAVLNERKTAAKIAASDIWGGLKYCVKQYKSKKHRNKPIYKESPHSSYDNFLKVSNGNWSWLDGYISGASKYIKEHVKPVMDKIEKGD